MCFLYRLPNDMTLQVYRLCTTIIDYHFNNRIRFLFQVTNRQTTETQFLYLGTGIQRFLGHCSVHVLVITSGTNWNVPASPGEMIFDLVVLVFIYSTTHSYQIQYNIRIKSLRYIMLVYPEAKGCKKDT